MPLSSSVELYGFATYSTRDNTSGGFYRRAANQARNPTFLFDGVTEVNGGEAYVTNGFLPLINTDIEDISANAGLTGELGEWEWDAGVGYGYNEFEFTISNSINASLVSAIGSSPTSADAGTLELGLTTVDIEFSRPLSWGHVAVGAAYREDTYEIKAGELLSYADFDTIDGVSLGPSDADAGIQVFSGFSPMNAVDEDRDAVSVYVDVEYDSIDRLLIGGALRWEDYSDFGSTVTGKLSSSFRFTDTFMVRGAASTGFRAPSLQQQFFNSTSTQFISDPDGGGGLIGVQRGTFRNDSQVAKEIGIPTLDEETSVNFSAGFVLQPADSLSITVDFYHIKIEDRIVISGAIGMGLDPNLDEALAAANADSAQFFLNAVDTTTKGVDFVAEWGTDLWSGDLGISLGANFTDTDIDKIKPPASLSSVPGIQDLVFPAQDQSILTEWQPSDRINLTGNYGKNGWNFMLAANRFGSYTVEEGDGSRQKFDEEVLVDTNISYAFDNGITFKLGGNNVFDVKPDKNTIGQSRGGTIAGPNGDVIVDSPGVFTYSRRSAPFGFNGAYWYGGVDMKF
jgi:iron complex outermembrane receptor protein